MNILAKILDQKRLEIAALDAQALRHAAEQSPTPRDFLAAIQRRRFGTQPCLIAELKRASPSKGILAPHLDLFQVADIYTQNGAAAIFGPGTPIADAAIKLLEALSSFPPLSH